MTDPTSTSEAPPGRRGPACLAACLAGLMIWAQWPTIVPMAERWWSDARYSHGVLVPIFSAFLLWRRGVIIAPWSPGSGPIAVGLIALGGVLQLAGAMVFLHWIEAASILPWLAALALLLGGREMLRRAAPSIAFLVFMIPLPYRVEVAAGAPMQELATAASTYLLQTFGLPATAEGNLISLDDTKVIAVVEACNGLGMLFTFACYTTAAAMVLHLPGAERAVMLLSALPLALGANVLRITSTGLVHRFCGNHAADVLFHEAAGWLMMPVALLMLWGESRLLGLLLIPTSPGSPAPRSIPALTIEGAAR